MWRRLAHLFVPCRGNDYRPNFLERASIGIMLILVLLSFALANLQSLLWISSDWLVSTILPAVIVDLTNEEREGGEITTLHRSATLDEAARLKAEDMAQNKYFAHYSPTGVSPWYWFNQVSYDFVSAGENLAVHFTESEDVVRAWMESPSHRANIMDETYQEIGVGTAKGEYKGYPTVFVVQLFGTQKATNEDVYETERPSHQKNTTQNITLETISLPAEVLSKEKKEAVVAPAHIDTLTVEDMYIGEKNDSSTLNAIDIMEIPSENTQVQPASHITENIVLYSDLATTSRPGIPVLSTQADASGAGDTPMILRSAIGSTLWLTVMYGVLASVVVCALSLSIFVEWRKQHPLQIAYAGGLLVLMGFLYYVHIGLTGAVTII